MAVPRRSAPAPPAPSVPSASQGYADISELDKYKLVSNIGKGSFGVISKVQRVEDGKEFAMKQLDYSKMTDKDRKQILAEVAILSSLKHKNIVQLIQKIFDPKNERIYIVMEYCTSGDLGSLIRKAHRSNQPLNEDKIWNIFLQIVLALHHCHWPESRGSKASRMSTAPNASQESKYQVLHRDLKPENVFLSDDFVKLGDFGLSKDMGTASFTCTYVGTPLYMPPEILAENRYDTKSDIWSLGCLVFELCALASPFSTAQTQPELIAMVKSGRLPSLPPQFSPALKGVIKAMLNLNPIKRPSTKDLLELDEMKLHRKLFTLQNQTNLLICRKEELSRLEASLQTRFAALEEREKQLAAREEALAQREAALSAREEDAKETQKRLNVAAETLRSQWDKFREEKEVGRTGLGLPGGQEVGLMGRRGSVAPGRPPLEERATFPLVPAAARLGRPGLSAYDETPSKIPVSTMPTVSPVPLAARLEALAVGGGQQSHPTPRRNNTKSLGNLREAASRQGHAQEAMEVASSSTYARTDATPAKQTISFPKGGRVSIGSPHDLRQVYSEDISMASPYSVGNPSPWVPRPRKSSVGGGILPSRSSDALMDCSPPSMIPAPVYSYRSEATPAKYTMDDPDLPSPFLKRFNTDPTPLNPAPGGAAAGERQVLGSINPAQNPVQHYPTAPAFGNPGGIKKGIPRSKSGGLHAQVLQRNANAAEQLREKERRSSAENAPAASGISRIRSTVAASARVGL